MGVLAGGGDGAAPIVERTQRHALISLKGGGAAAVAQCIAFAEHREVPETVVIWIDDEAYPRYVME